MPKQFSSNTTIYTGIATGSSIVTLEESKLDLFGTRTAFDNLINLVKTRSTAEEVGLLLFTSHMMIDEPNPKIISAEHYRKLMEIVPQEVKDLVVKDDALQTYKNFQNYMAQSHTNFIYELLGLNHRHYSANKILQKLKALRIQSSDMIELKYSSDDAGICTNTLALFNEVFMRKYSDLKASQYHSVVAYFEEQLKLANDKLHNAENELLEFNKSNNIINYYEQTKHIASEKEHFNLAFNDIQREFASSESVMKTLEGKMTSRQRAKINSNEILEIRNQLASTKAEILTEMSEAFVDSDEDTQRVSDLDELRQKADNLENQLRQSVTSGFYLDNSIEGLSAGKVLQEWLDKAIEFESTKAAIDVGRLQNKEYRRLYQLYAPLGATMKRLERKIDVIEREYLSVLHSLGLAKLKEKNIELNTSLRVIDEPRFSLMAQPSKRKYIIIIAFLVGFIIPAFIILVLDFIDGSIRNASRAEKMIGIKPLCMFPQPLPPTSSLDNNFIQSKSIDSLVSKFLLLTDESRIDKKLIQTIIYSNENQEGKTHLTSLILQQLNNLGYKSLFLNHDSLENTIEGCTHINYNVDSSFHKVSDTDQLLPSDINKNDYDFVFIEFPQILSQSLPVDLVKNSDFSLLITRANRSWSTADKDVLSDYSKANNNINPQLIINGVEAYEMEEVIGNIPRLHSIIRSLFIKVISFRPFTKKATV